MAVTDWSTVPGNNATIGGANIAEGCPPANINNAIREIMASVRVMYDELPTVTGFMPLSGGVFSGTQPKYQSEGAFIHHASASMVSGRIHVLPEGSANPAGLANGDMIFYYA